VPRLPQRDPRGRVRAAGVGSAVAHGPAAVVSWRRARRGSVFEDPDACPEIIVSPFDLIQPGKRRGGSLRQGYRPRGRRRTGGLRACARNGRGLAAAASAGMGSAGLRAVEPGAGRLLVALTPVGGRRRDFWRVWSVGFFGLQMPKNAFCFQYGP